MLGYDRLYDLGFAAVSAKLGRDFGRQKASAQDWKKAHEIVVETLTNAGADIGTAKMLATEIAGPQNGRFGSMR